MSTAMARVAIWVLAGLLGLLPIAGYAQTTVKYVHTDALGSVVAMTNASGAVVETTREYEPYGLQLAPVIQDGPGYTGHVQDAATGLTYMQQRYYDPQIGLFLSVDPVTAMSNPIGLFNRYRYAANSPYSYIDPDGRNCEKPTGSHICGGGAGNNVSTIQVASPSSPKATAAGAAVAIGAGTVSGSSGGAGVAGTLGSGARAVAGVLGASASAAAIGIGAAVYSSAIGVGSDDISPIALYHGTSASHGFGFLNGMLLSQVSAVSNNLHGSPGFYLATDPAAAEVFGAYHADSRGSLVLQFILSRQAMSTLTQAGARFQPIPQGGLASQPPGAEFYVPLAAFGTFNALIGSGQIGVSPYSGD